MHRDPLLKRYRAFPCSLAACFSAATVVALVLVPLYLAWVSHDFWIGQQVIYEQPQVTFKHSMYVAVEGVDASDQPFSLVWTTSPVANDLLSSIRAPSIRSSSTDDNLDDRADSLSFSLKLPLADGERVHRAVVVASLQLAFKERARVTTDTLAVLDASSPLPGSSVSLSGDLVLHQRYPVRSSGGFSVLSTDDALPLSTASSVTDLSLPSILSTYSARNFTTSLSSSTGGPTWVTDTSGVTSSSPLASSPRAFSASLTIRVPPMTLLVFPYLSEELKHAWIQYLALLLPTLYVLRWIRHFTFAHAVLQASVTNDAAPVRKLHQH